MFALSMASFWFGVFNRMIKRSDLFYVVTIINSSIQTIIGVVATPGGGFAQAPTGVPSKEGEQPECKQN